MVSFSRIFKKKCFIKISAIRANSILFLYNVIRFIRINVLEKIRSLNNRLNCKDVRFNFDKVHLLKLRPEYKLNLL